MMVDTRERTPTKRPSPLTSGPALHSIMALSGLIMIVYLKRGRDELT